MGKTAEELMKLIKPRNAVRTDSVSELSKLIRPRSIAEDEDVQVEPEGFFDVIGNTLQHFGKLASDREFWFRGFNPIWSKEFFTAGVPGIGERGTVTGALPDPVAGEAARNFTESGMKAFRYMTETPISRMPMDAVRGLKSKVIDPFTGVAGALVSSPAETTDQILGGLLRSFTQTPLEAISGTKLDAEGNVVPLTPQEQALKVQETAGVALATSYAIGRHATLNAIKRGEGAVAAANQKTLGALAKYVANDTRIGAESGLISGFIAGAGTEDHMGRILGDALAFAPLGMVFGSLGYRGHRKAQTLAKLEYIQGLSWAPVELATIRDLRVTSDKSIQDILAGIDALGTSNDVVEAAVRSRLDVGDGIIVDGLDDAYVQQLQHRLGPAEKRVKPVWNPDDSVKGVLDRVRPNIGGKIQVGLNFLDYFDKAAYLAKGSSKTGQKMMLELKALGLSEEDIIAHGKKVDKVISERAAAGNVRPPTQVEIDQATDAIRQRGNERLIKMGEGQSFKDYTGRTWVKQGGLITDGEQTIKIESDLAKLTIGRNKKEADPQSGKIEIESIEFDNTFSRKSYEMHVYKGGESTLITPFKLNKTTQEFFAKSGYLPNEVVIINGKGTEAIVRKPGSVKVLNEPSERITHAAFKVGDRYFVGDNHGTAARAASKAGIDVNKDPKAMGAVYGFWTSKNRFVLSQEAGQLGLNAKQISLPSTDSKLLQGVSSEDFLAADDSFGLKVDPKLGLRSVDSGERFPNPEIPVEPGFVRFYHGGTENTGGKRWLSPDRKFAESYAKKSASGKLYYVDLPENHPLLTKAFDDSGTSSKAPYNAFEAPENIAKNLKLVDNNSAESLEIPVVPGTSGRIELQDVQTGKIIMLRPDQIRRQPKGINSEFYKFGDERVGKLGVLDQSTFFGKLYDDFKTKFLLNEVPREDFESVFLRFTESIGMRSKEDVFRLQAAFYKRLREDAIKLASTPEDAAHLKDVQISLEKSAAQYLDDKGHMLRSALEEQGMYMKPIGSGAYELRFIEDNELFLKVSNVDQAIEAINKSKQKTDGQDLDGGNSGGVPPAALNPGSAGFPTHVGGIPLGAGWLDAMNVGKVPYLAMSRDFIASIDAITEGRTQLTGRIAEPLQLANMKYKAFAQRPDAKKFSDKFNEIAMLVKKHKLNEAQLASVSDAIEALSIDEIENKMLPLRPMSTAEKSYAKGLSTKDVESVVEYMYQVKDAIGDVSFSSMEAAKARADIMAKGVFGPDVIKAGDDLMLNRAGDPDKFSIYAVLRLAQAYAHPHLALDRATFMARNRFTPGMVSMVKELDKYYKDGARLFGIDVKARINGYLPHIRLSKATGHNPFALPGTATARFIHELTRVGITSNGKLLRNPIEISYRYLQAGFRVKSGFADDLVGIKQAFNEELKNLQKSNPDMVMGVRDLVGKHIDGVKGIPHIEEQLARAIKTLFRDKLGWMPSSKSLIALSEMAAQGARTVFLFRDVVSVAVNTYAAFGATFAKNMFTTDISFKQIKQLVANKEIPAVEGLDIIYPGDGPLDIIEGDVLRGRKMMKAADTALTLTGQKHIYQLMYTKMYLHTRDLVDKLSKDLVDNKIKKDDMYMQLGLSVHNPGVIRHFDNLISAGEYESAAKFLGNWNAKFVANAFGNNNNPISWSARFGRVAGQYGSWGTNELQTLGNMLTRGTGAERITRGTRLMLANALVYESGAALGLDMKSWLIWPFGLFGMGPIPMTAIELSRSAAGAFSSNDDSRGVALRTLDRFVPMISYSNREGLHFDSDNIGNIFLPYSYMVQDVVQGVDLWDREYGATAALRLAGFQVDEDTRSLLQDVTGFQPRSDKGLLVR